MYKFLLIAPYRGMKDLLDDISSSLPYEVRAEVGDLKHGLTIAKTAEQQGYDVIISRGGTAKLIRQHMTIPVVEITVNGYDILRSLTFVKEYQGTIGIIGFPSVVYGVDTIAELLGIHVLKFVINHESEAEGAVSKARDHGVSLVIGDVVTVAAAEHAGMRAILITTGREALLESLEKAKETANSAKIENEKIQAMKSMLNALLHGIMSVDAGGDVIFCNDQAAALVGIDAARMIGMKGSDLIEKAQLNDENIQEKSIIWFTRSIPNGGINYEIYSKGDVQQLDVQLRRAQEDQVSPPKSQFQQLIQTDHINDTYMDKAKRWSKRSEPILFAGEPGTGKKSVAEAMHNESLFHTGPFVSFRPGLAAPEQQDSLLFGKADSETSALIQRAKSGTLYIHHIDDLQLPIQKKLAAALQASLAEQPDGNSCSFRLMASTSADLSHKVQLGQFDMQLLLLLQIYSLQLPPLRMFIADLEHVAFWYLAEMNRTLGKQVLGIKPDVMKLLKLYPWPGNFQELKQVLKLLIESCDSSFINIQQSEPILDRLFKRTDIRARMDLSQLIADGRTLNDMERDIIQLVLEEEGFNQSTTANRLGINRTTLWRKLNHAAT